MAYVVCAIWTVEAGHEDQVLGALRELAVATRAERGNLGYSVAKAVDNPGVIHLYEVYEDEAAYQAHGDSEHFQRLAVQMAIPLLHGRERMFYHTVDI